MAGILPGYERDVGREWWGVKPGDPLSPTNVGERVG
jgi:hypothetical protein